MLRPRRYIIRNSNGPEHLELFLIAGVASILIIRAFLKATGYPHVGGEGLHIAHMLWGGLFMAVAMFLTLSLLGPTVNRLAAILGGIGFGTFIDELGKFITSDNDYFFEPTIGIIYIIFIAIFLTLRTLTSRSTLTPEESLANALNRLEGSVEGLIDESTRREVLTLLEEADSGGPLYGDLKAYVQSIETGALTRLGFYFKIKDWLLAYYGRLVRARVFAFILLGFFTVEAVVQMAFVMVFFLGRYLAQVDSSFSFAAAAQSVSGTIAAALTTVGLWQWRKSRSTAYTWFTRSILTNIFITQIFVFFESQLAGITGLILNILIYLALRYLADAEKSLAVTDAKTIASGAHSAIGPAVHDLGQRA